MRKTILTLTILMGGMLGTQAQTWLTLDDTKDLTNIINAAAEAGGTYNITFSDRSINLNNWNVLCLPFDTTPAKISKAFGYAVVDLVDRKNDDGNLHFEPTVSGVIKAGTPFVIHVSKSQNSSKVKTNFNQVNFFGITLSKVTPTYTVSDLSHNNFIGSFSPIDVWGQKIWYMSKGRWLDARNFSEEKPVSLKPMRCYIDFSDNTSNVKPLIIIEEPDGTTSIVSPEAFSEGQFSTDATQDDGWYSITGTRLSEKPTTHGIYIHQGKKVIVK